MQYAGHLWVEMRCRPLDCATTPHADARRWSRCCAMSAQRRARDRIARAESERANAAKSRFLPPRAMSCTPLNAIISYSDMLGNIAGTQRGAQT
jgi:hypothetical protein